MSGSDVHARLLTSVLSVIYDWAGLFFVLPSFRAGGHAQCPEVMCDTMSGLSQSVRGVDPDVDSTDRAWRPASRNSANFTLV